MRISRQTDYALRALFDLVAHHGQAPVSVSALAKRNRIPKRFLAQILLDLKRAGWVASSQGKNGGYFLARNPDTISFGRIIRHFHGVLAPLGCVSVMRYQRCALEATCAFRHIFKEIRDHAAALLDRETLASVYAASLAGRGQPAGKGLPPARGGKSRVK